MLFLFLVCFSASSEALIKGYIDSVSARSDGKVRISGWACDSGVALSINVHIYLGGPAGKGGTLYKGATANQASSTSIAASCGTTDIPHRYSVEMSLNDVTLHKGKVVYVYGISTSNPNELLKNSGVFVVPDTSGTTYTATAAANTGGSISPPSRSVNIGEKTTFTLSPNTGYKIDSVIGCGGSLSDAIYTTGTMGANCNIQANFSLKSYTVNTSTSTGGSISPPNQSVTHGGVASFTLTPYTGYEISAVNGCGGSFSDATSKYNTAPTTASCTVSADFKPSTYTISTNTSSGGSVSPTSSNVVYNNSTTFSISAQIGYAIKNVTGCSGNLVGNSYITAAITTNCSINVSFEKLPKLVQFEWASKTVYVGEATTFHWNIENVTGCTALTADTGSSSDRAAAGTLGPWTYNEPSELVTKWYCTDLMGNRFPTSGYLEATLSVSQAANNGSLDYIYDGLGRLIRVTQQ
jgi:hypothetical protein